MYEEEDDELPSQYKNLNAHLQTGSTDFDARLQAYLANAVAFRKALSGVAKNRDKANNVDFVNTRQLADHQALFPKHSDAWKDVVIPKKSTDSAVQSQSPFLPQGSLSLDARKFNQPYNPKSSGLTSRRMSASKGSADTTENMDNMGTLRASDLKPRSTTYQPAARHPSLPKPKLQERDNTPAFTDNSLEHAGINYASLDRGSLNRSSSSSDSTVFSDYPFSSRLPANAVDMLLPWNQPAGTPGLYDNAPYYDASLFHPKPQDTIDATLCGPSSQSEMPTPAYSEYTPQSFSAWQNSSANQLKESSASRKLVEDNMWGNFIEEPEMNAWEWTNTC